MIFFVGGSSDDSNIDFLVIVAFSFVSNQISLLRIRLYRRNTELATAIEKIERMAITDELTGLTNRRHMMHMLRRQKAVADRGGNEFCVCFSTWTASKASMTGWAITSAMSYSNVFIRGSVTTAGFRPVCPFWRRRICPLGQWRQP
jgi:hypothetical protein